MQMHQRSLESSSWIGHVCCAQGVIRALQGQNFAESSPESVVLGWALYFDVMARFSLRHWRVPVVKEIARDLGFNPDKHAECATQYLLARNSFSAKIPELIRHAHPVLGLLSETFVTLTSNHPQYHTKTYQEYLADLKSRLLHIQHSTITACHKEKSENDQSFSAQIELFPIVALIYLERTALNFSGNSIEIHDWTEAGFNLLTSEGAFQWPFAIFILGLEARSDQQRVRILEVLERASRYFSHMHVRVINALIQQSWIQDDLADGEETDYARKLNLIVSVSKAIPSFC